MILKHAPFMILGATGLGLLAALSATPSKPRPVEIASYATPLQGRTRNQKRNARLAASAINGAWIAPGQTFSFNRAVRSWSRDAGFVKAPVSFGGELVRAYGGGVCQTSTTLYNAALLAGLPVIERHPHTFRPRYAIPGRDAAVAFPGVDLRIRNDFTFPIRVRAVAEGDLLRVSIWGARKPQRQPKLETVVLGVTDPQRLTRVSRAVLDAGGKPQTGSRAFGRSVGARGFRVATYRTRWNGRWTRERLSDDTYVPMNRVIALTSDEVPAS